MLTLRELLLWGQDQLKLGNDEEYRQNARILLEHVQKLEPASLIASYGKEAAKGQIEQYQYLIKKKKNGIPLAYLLGKCEFYGLPFWVTQDTLIPRPETELLIDVILKKTQTDLALNILDLCTGSGCIGITLAKQFQNASVTLMDISAKALDIAKKNSQLNGLQSRIQCMCGDVFELKLEDELYDIMVSNPPYVRSCDMDNLDKSVKNFEPLQALDGGIQGLDFYKVIIKKHKYALKTKGILALEFGNGQDPLQNMAQDIKAMLMQNGFSQIEIYKDYNQKERVITAIKEVIQPVK